MKLAVADLIKQDVTSISVSTFLSNLLRYMTPAEISAQFPTHADVPLHLYKCAAELLVTTPVYTAGGFSIGAFTNAVIYQSGRGQAIQEFGIELKETTSDSWVGKGGDQDDLNGAEVGWLKIINRLETPDPTIDYPRHLDLRLRYILDFKTRSLCQPAGGTWNPGSLLSGLSDACINPYGSDNTIDYQAGIQLEWFDVGSTSDDVRERVSIYRGLFNRNYA